MRAWFRKVKDRDSSPVIRSQARQFAKALEMHEVYMAMRDSLVNEDNTREITIR